MFRRGGSNPSLSACEQYSMKFKARKSLIFRLTLFYRRSKLLLLAPKIRG